MGWARAESGEVGSVITPSITSTVLFPHWGPRPTNITRSLGPYERRVVASLTWGEGQDVVEGRSNKREGPPPGPLSKLGCKSFG